MYIYSFIPYYYTFLSIYPIPVFYFKLFPHNKPTTLAFYLKIFIKRSHVMKKILLLLPLFICSCNSATLEVNGIVKEIAEIGHQDIVVKIMDDQTLYYINRGAERLDVDSIRSILKGKEISIRAKKSESPLGICFPINELYMGKTCIFKK